MVFLETTLKVVRILSALVWLAVGVVTLWGTWITFRELGPYIKTLTGIVGATGPQGLLPTLPSSLTADQLRQFIGPRNDATPVKPAPGS